MSETVIQNNRPGEPIRIKNKIPWGGVIVLLIFMLFFYSPLLYMCLLAFANKYEVPHMLPTEWGVQYWQYVLGQPNVARAILNSFLFAFASTGLALLICVPAAYALARFNFKGRKFIMLLFLVGNAFPKIGMYTSIGIIYYRIGLMGTFLGVLLIHMLGTMMQMIWLPVGAFRSVPRHQEESSRDVGAGPIRTFFHVTLPIAWPGIAVAAMYAFIGSLGESVGTLMVGLPKYRTMMTEMYGIILDFPATAGAVFGLIIVIPNIILLILMRNYIGGGTLAKGFKMS